MDMTDRETRMISILTVTASQLVLDGAHVFRDA
jgi:hypothetical protein